MDPLRFLNEITHEKEYRDQLEHLRVIPARQAEYADLAHELHPRVQRILDNLGIKRLYSHQVEAIDAALDGENTVVVTGTSSGKTFTYLVPLAEKLARRPASRALLLYPTKALAQDQLRKLAEFGAGDAFTAETYDGDTPRSLRRQIRRQAQVILTNPDMLHIGILPYHSTWASFFRNLEYIVLDEVHTYRGIFGAHTANVIRRLRRIARHYGADPQFICCSATIGNPEHLARELTGVDAHLIDRDGAPAGRRVMGWWNPPLASELTGERRSSNSEAAKLIAAMAREDIRSITFTLSRTTTELLLRYARDLLAEDGLSSKIMAYRGGYLPEQRRDIERRLFDGELLAVASTTALELGVDIGGLDAVLMLGYPGSIASVWQQAGRAGRSGRDSLAILIAVGGGIHQYLMRHPEYLLTTGVEQVAIDPYNEFVVGSHLLCAAYELPIEAHECGQFGPKAPQILELLTQERYLMRRNDKWYWTFPEHYPAGAVSIRSISGAPYNVVIHGTDELLATEDADSAMRTLHQGAIYMHAGETYRVVTLDLEKRTASVVKDEVRYYTRPMIASKVEPRTELEHVASGALDISYGMVSITSQVTGYRRISQSRHRELEVVELDLPSTEFETTGIWLSDENALEMCLAGGFDIAGSLHALEHSMIGLLPLFAMCDQRDAAGASEPVHHQTGRPTIFIYDGYPGGVGIARMVYFRLGELLTACAETLESCPCEDGCPACVQSPFCGSNNEPLDKCGAAALARHWASLVTTVDEAANTHREP